MLAGASERWRDWGGGQGMGKVAMTKWGRVAAGEGGKGTKTDKDDENRGWNSLQCKIQNTTAVTVTMSLKNQTLFCKIRAQQEISHLTLTEQIIPDYLCSPCYHYSTAGIKKKTYVTEAEVRHFTPRHLCGIAQESCPVLYCAGPTDLQNFTMNHETSTFNT